MAPREALRVLIVEDEFLVALELEAVTVDAGHHVIAVADQLEEVLRIAGPQPIDLAFVDVNLKDGRTGPQVATHLAHHGATVVFLTGNVEQIPPDFCGAIGAVPKPFTAETLAEVIDFAAALRAQERPAVIPRTLVIAPKYER